MVYKGPFPVFKYNNIEVESTEPEKLDRRMVVIYQERRVMTTITKGLKIIVKNLKRIKGFGLSWFVCVPRIKRL